ncbi:prefoldin subunit 2, putative [Cryptosporidium muris RN66]|uniref:Prefoldin subunit 2, putative n=1 Tax=Cryptosporidium muris (strain RN66) TaxID=441375 RepID=B6AF36_CRYMR|nr:prefoldin subunit 2, putative [Cryptosporidium muris RN66]EEA06803.1 prefoldin subunit 2, putative [Cryptosporidium muris RN66]|eukprot:XP_002141152.1 prefoldin subunit 2 [Cryptosporidium muris RN66]
MVETGYTKETQEEIVQLDKKLKLLNNKISELTQDSKEYGLVLNAFEKVDENRRCFRVIGGVMVERNVKTVKPALEKEKSALDSAISELEKQYESIEEEMKNLIEKYSTNSADPAQITSSSSSQ